MVQIEGIRRENVIVIFSTFVGYVVCVLNIELLHYIFPSY